MHALAKIIANMAAIHGASSTLAKKPHFNFKLINAAA